MLKCRHTDKSFHYTDRHPSVLGVLTTTPRVPRSFPVRVGSYLGTPESLSLLAGQSPYVGGLTSSVGAKR